MPSASGSGGKKSRKGDKNGTKNGTGPPEYTATGSAFDFLHMKRGRGKRKVKPVDTTNFQAIGLFEDSESDDSDYKPKEDENGDDIDVDSDGVVRGEDKDQDDEADDKDDSDDSENDDSDADSAMEAGDDLSIAVVAGVKFDGASVVDKLDLATKSRKLLVCSVCNGDYSHEIDEIVECDSCGITVHEGCYGIVADDTDNESIHSNASSDPTEPWFCDACKVHNENPICELCPNAGGIFKQTDAGRWVHLVCCLYINGVAFADTARLTGITLFELAYDRFGAKVCTLCEDERVARTGVCVQCDAGMCKNYFHVTCAQREGLLHEAQANGQQLSETELIDPFYAHCKLHAGDKAAAKAKRRNWLALQSRIRTRRENQTPLSDRTLKKLEKARVKYRQKFEAAPKPWVPTQKIPRLLTTSPKAVKTLLKKAELLGFSPQGHYFASHDLVDVRRKWHIPPAFSVEFVSYYLDRNNRMSTMAKRLEELRKQNKQLKDTEAETRQRYEGLIPQYDKLKNEEKSLRDKARHFWTILNDLGHKEDTLPKFLESPVKEVKKEATASNSASAARNRGRPTKDKNANRAVVLNECGLCHKSTDQHRLALCDSCGLYYHLHCLDPPLTRMPKKTRFGGWQCSECTEKEDEDEPEPVADQDASNSSMDGQRKLRESRKGPDKFVPDADQNPTPPPSSHQGKRKRGRPPGSLNKRKPKKVRIAVSLSEDGSQSQSLDFDSSPMVCIEPLSMSLLKKSQVKTEKVEHECCKCKLVTDSRQLVQCDECELYYHFGCLDPPVKKNPKQRGYQWFCEECDSSSDEDESGLDSDSDDSDRDEEKGESSVKDEPSSGDRKAGSAEVKAVQ